MVSKSGTLYATGLALALLVGSVPLTPTDAAPLTVQSSDGARRQVKRSIPERAGRDTDMEAVALLVVVAVIAGGWIGLVLLAGYIWKRRNLGFWRGVLIGILLTPILSVVIALVKERGPEPPRKDPAATLADMNASLREQSRSAARARAAADQTRKCPFCAEEIKAAAIVCRYCGRDIPRPEAEPPTTS